MHECSVDVKSEYEYDHWASMDALSINRCVLQVLVLDGVGRKSVVGKFDAL